MMTQLVIGILAHVDAGKTTLSESMLYLTGKIGKLGRVDNQDAYLDTHELEKARGITIFSKQALIQLGTQQITLLDTPGHVDFSAEMERTLQVLDYAILVINGADGIQGHTKTLWKLLSLYKVPVFIFVNKMDQIGTDKDVLVRELQEELSDGCIEFHETKTNEFYEEIAMCKEILLEEYLETGSISPKEIKNAIKERKIFPCFFGSALKLEGIEPFLKGMEYWTIPPAYSKEFGAKIFKISRDDQGNRLTHMKLTGGTLKVKDTLSNSTWSEKVNQIRIYSGTKFETKTEIEAGTICALTGLTQTKPGEGLGIEKNSITPLLEPVLSYRMVLPSTCDERAILPKLRQMEEEIPELHIVFEEQLNEIQVQMMGEVQIEILQTIVEERFGIVVSFDEGRIVYKETIANTVEGVGHFEPLRHYAEVHLLLEPLEAGSGLVFDSQCSEDILSKNWQRLILTHLQEKTHKGVLTGSTITDMKITLVSGKAHNKHTEGGDFREATYRAIRQGLKQASSVLLEPYYSFQLEVPEKMVGRAMTDIEKMHGSCELSQTNSTIALLTGSAPVSTMRNYQREVIAYTKGLGRLFCSLKGYEACHNPEEIMERIAYDSERDIENPTGSVFCAHGAGFIVPWDEVKDHMHIESILKKEPSVKNTQQEKMRSEPEKWISLEEINQIMNKTFYSNQGDKSIWKKKKSAQESYYESQGGRTYTVLSKEKKEEYLLIDGYNIIHAWPELKELVDDNMDGARERLLEIISNYQGIRNCQMIVVFDAYRLKGHQEEVIQYHNIHAVYTKEAQTADQYIEKFAHENKKDDIIYVATSDGLQQIIVRGAGAYLISARELKQDIETAMERMKKEYGEEKTKGKQYLLDSLDETMKEQMEQFESKET